MRVMRVVYVGRMLCSHAWVVCELCVVVCVVYTCDVCAVCVMCVWYVRV